MEWFLYDRDLRYERVKSPLKSRYLFYWHCWTPAGLECEPSKLVTQHLKHCSAVAPLAYIDSFLYHIIQFRWQFENTNSRFWLVNTLLRKFETLSKKEIKMIKTQILWWKTTKKYQKSIYKHIVAFFTQTRPTEPWCNMLRTLERQRKYICAILSDEHTRIYFYDTNINTIKLNIKLNQVSFKK